MFGLSWSEIMILMVVALVVIGPKDLPIAIKAVTRLIRRARSMASEFQGHLDEVVREANLNEVRDELTKLRRFDLARKLETTLAGDIMTPLKQAAAATTAMPGPDIIYGPQKPIFVPPALSAADLPPPDDTARAQTAPAFIPPHFAARPPAPAFIPPRVRRFAHRAR